MRQQQLASYVYNNFSRAVLVFPGRDVEFIYYCIFLYQIRSPRLSYINVIMIQLVARLQEAASVLLIRILHLACSYSQSAVGLTATLEEYTC